MRGFPPELPAHQGAFSFYLGQRYPRSSLAKLSSSLIRFLTSEDSVIIDIYIPTSDPVILDPIIVISKCQGVKWGYAANAQRSHLADRTSFSRLFHSSRDRTPRDAVFRATACNPALFGKSACVPSLVFSALQGTK